MLGRERPQTAFAGNVSEMARQSGMERDHVRAYLRNGVIEKS